MGNSRRRIAVCLLPTLAALAAAPARAEAPVALSYEMTLGGLPVMTLELDEHSGAGRYRLDFTAETEGIANWVFRNHTVASSDGRLRDGQPAPDDYASSAEGTKPHFSRLTYRPGGAIAIEASALPPEERDATPVPPEAVPGTLDPLTGMLVLTRGVASAGCAGTVPIFDGHRRYDLELRPTGPDAPKRSDETRYAGPVAACALHMTRIAGYSPDRTKYLSGDDATLWLAPVLEGEQPVPVEIAFHSRWGTMRVTLRRVETGLQVAARP